jgi:NAD dependent epimerase/dehydratase family enzyme
MGEANYIVTKGNRVIPEKLILSKFNFQFTQLKDALEDLLIKQKNKNEINGKFN